MQLICGQMNGKTLDAIHQSCIGQCSSVLIAVAYADGKKMDLLEDCKRLAKPVEFYGRHDWTVPVHPAVLKWFLDADSPSMTCGLIHEYYHPKVIWWVGAGAYIGSANLTPRAWDRNIEAGVFMSEDELSRDGLGTELLAFFTTLQEIATPLRREIWLDQLAQHAKVKSLATDPEAEARKFFEGKNRVPATAFPWLTTTSKTAFQKFKEDWEGTIQILRTIAKRVSDPAVRPTWIREDVPAFVQGDQFLHAFYYKNARKISRVKELHAKNKMDREKALREALADWNMTPKTEALEEAMHMHKWAPLVSKLCEKTTLQSMTCDEFAVLLQHVHAARDHVSHGPLSFMPPEAYEWTLDQRLSSLARYLWDKKSACGWGVREVLYYVVWGANGSDAEPVPDRLWRAAHGDAQLPHLGLGTLGELIGWARSDRYPPRNGRTSKALLALGHTVSVNLNSSAGVLGQ